MEKELNTLTKNKYCKSATLTYSLKNKREAVTLKCECTELIKGYGCTTVCVC